MLTSSEFPETHPSMIAALREGQTASHWIEFYQRYAPAIFRVARYRGMDRHDAEDLVQQVMLNISRHIDRFDYRRDRGQFRNWVRRIAENKIIDLARRSQVPAISVETLVEPRDDRPTLDDLWDQEWRLQDVLFCVDECRRDIAPRTYEAFRLYVVDGLSAKDTAARLNMSVEQVYVTRNQVLNRVRKLIADLEIS